MRPFVDIRGRIYPCERVNESANMQIGHIDSGFDISKIDAILNIGRLTETECKGCWNFFLCSLCVAACDGGDKLCRETKLKNCERAKSTTFDILLKICLLVENGYDFDKLQISTTEGA